MPCSNIMRVRNVRNLFHELHSIPLTKIMENRRGSFHRRRGYHGRNQQDGNFKELYQKPRAGGDRPPPGLKGKEIGLWYARRGKEKREKMTRRTVHMDEEQMGLAHRALYNARHHGGGKTFKERGAVASSSSISSSIKEEDSKDERVSSSFYDDDIDIMLEASGEDENSWFKSRLGLKDEDSVNQKLREDFLARKEDPRYREMQSFRMGLPAYKMKDELLELINNNRVIVISGETGCGKTTQVPQFILDAALEQGKGLNCKVVCTQPRRISAISVAERVASERAEACGRNQSCGYQIRLQARLPRDQASILYCTTGIMIQWLQSDPLLQHVSHVILDEVHERALHSDFLMTLIKNILEKRKDLRVILMSATLNAELFSSYLDNCPKFHIPGFTFPVKSIFLEEIMELTNYRPSNNAFDVVAKSKMKKQPRKGWRPRKDNRHVGPEEFEKWEEYAKQNLYGKISRQACENLEAMHMFLQNSLDPQLVVSTIKYIVRHQPPGAILVFVPGWMDIKAVNDLLQKDRQFSPDRYLIIPLHSMMPTTNQREVFLKPPEGVTKIVIATNIAETSITIEDVVHVIDTGKIKISDFDPDTNMGSLQTKWISRANAKQRRGRAGRVQEGFCYHLYTKLQEEGFDDFLLPEMLRTPLDQLCLQIRLLKLGKIEDFLSKVIESPSPEAVNLSIQKLTSLNALDVDQNLTSLAYHLARLPVEPQIGKMILMGAMFSCLDPVLTVASNLSFKDPFIIPLGKEKDADAKRKQLAKGTNSDHIMLLNAFKGWEQAKEKGYHAENEYCWNHFLSKSTLKMLYDMKLQFAQHLHSIGFSPSTKSKEPEMNRLSDNTKVVLSVICAGLYPNVGKIVPTRPDKIPRLQTKTEGRVNFHLKSVNANTAFGQFKYPWVCYYLKMRTAGVYLFDASEISVYPLLFFGGSISAYFDREMKQDVIAVDDWIIFQSKPKIAKLVQDLRDEMNQILERKIKDPGMTVLHKGDPRNTVLSSIVNLITTET